MKRGADSPINVRCFSSSLAKATMGTSSEMAMMATVARFVTFGVVGGAEADTGT